MGIFSVVGISLFFLMANPTVPELSYLEFREMVKEGKVTSVTLNPNSDKIIVKDKNGMIYQSVNPEYEDFKNELLLSDIQVHTERSLDFETVIGAIIDIAFSVGFLVLIFYILNRTGKSTKMEVPVEHPGVTFNDVAGYEEQKQDLSTYVEYLKNPSEFVKNGAQMPKGVLLYGPPGTGKTLFARAIAGEAGVPFYSVSGSDFVEMYVGVGAKRVRQLFEAARKTTPCIIFIDELDAIGGKRGLDSNTEHAQTINALLSEMDGFQRDSGILVLATTNRPDFLDPALTRSGRFDSHICIPLPSSKTERLQIIELHAKGRKLAEDIRLEDLAKQWIGFSGADIESVLNEASILAVRRKLPVVTKECLDEAFYKKVLKGHIKKRAQTERSREELKVVAYHEAGHAVARKLLGAGEVAKVTILSTTNGAGGVTFNVPEKMGLFSVDELEKEIRILYAGRAAEYLYFNKNQKKVTTGAENDIKQATILLKKLVMECGFQKDCVLLDLKQVPEADGYAFQEMKELSQRLYQETVVLLENHYPLLETVAQILLEKETLESDELNRIIEDARPFVA
ncbi:ATP-dependent metallopeptidase FtsH/Yme1/Tma family protein [Caldibacillus debilis]|uniref:ATP-dependent metallopeptidase FtsH/Yme1/Tma family protein n=1 Tax=Caldibacillus debilis TaxID=301148 RepID=UPI0011C47A82|nr:FtsH/Yme1/Tma family ATP-dependent metallopeptidase [Caldibacillus debilis]